MVIKVCEIFDREWSALVVKLIKYGALRGSIFVRFCETCNRFKLLRMNFLRSDIPDTIANAAAALPQDDSS